MDNKRNQLYQKIVKLAGVLIWLKMSVFYSACSSGEAGLKIFR